MIDTTTTQMTSPSAEGPSLASHRMPSRRRLAPHCRRAGAFLSGAAGANYDLLASSDVVPYLRRLEELFRVAAAAAAPKAAFAFSVEKPLGGGEVEIGATGRFRHSVAYCEACAAKSGWTLSARRDAVLRKNCGSDVHGHVLVFQRS